MLCLLFVYILRIEKYKDYGNFIRKLQIAFIR